MSNKLLSKILPCVQCRVDYMMSFAVSPRSFGTLFPSSGQLCKRMAESVDWLQINCAAELGAGDGVLTRHLLSRLKTDAVLEAWKIQPKLVRKLIKLQEMDPRLQVVNKFAEKMTGKYDAIFSCLPLLSLPVMVRGRILKRACNALNDGGVFIQFQYSTVLKKTLSCFFEWTRSYEVVNVPPAWVYICTPHQKCNIRGNTGDVILI
ncbi:methyltransferase [Escherichia coli]|nr:methyltransferase [Escherichia coli]